MAHINIVPTFRKPFWGSLLNRFWYIRVYIGADLFGNCRSDYKVCRAYGGFTGFPGLGLLQAPGIQVPPYSRLYHIAPALQQKPVRLFRKRATTQKGVESVVHTADRRVPF